MRTVIASEFSGVWFCQSAPTADGALVNVSRQQSAGGRKKKQKLPAISVEEIADHPALTLSAAIQRLHQLPARHSTSQHGTPSIDLSSRRQSAGTEEGAGEFDGNIIMYHLSHSVVVGMGWLARCLIFLSFLANDERRTTTTTTA